MVVITNSRDHDVVAAITNMEEATGIVAAIANKATTTTAPTRHIREMR